MATVAALLCVTLPFHGLFWYGTWRNRKAMERLLVDAVAALHLVRIRGH